MGAYYISYMHPELDKAEFLIEQGQDMGRDGFCRTFAQRETDGEISVKIAGTATLLKKQSVEVED
jgi:predicted PhzF superfamily epimerase YddE/YHI9